MIYLVDLGNGFVEGYNETDFEQEFNTSEKLLFLALRLYGFKEFKIISPAELDELRGYHAPTLAEYFGGKIDEESVG